MTLRDSAHTPGPWRALCLSKYTRVVRDRQGPADKDTGSVQICHIAGPQEDDLRPFNKDRWEADARLIAAAPELLAALKNLVEISEQLRISYGPAAKHNEARRAARAAITKAAGGNK